MNGTTKLRLYDTHFHLDLSRDPAAVVRLCEADGIYTIAVTNAPSVFSATQTLVAGAKFLRAAIGLHPELVLSHAHELDQFWHALDQTRYVGEVGLDYVTPDQANRAKQRAVLIQILDRCSRSHDKIITLHSRRAAGDVIDTVGPGFSGNVILHWYSGNRKDLKKAVNYGFYFSINPRMLVSESATRLIDDIPRDRLLLETDGPFVTVGERPAGPQDTAIVVQCLANRWNLRSEEAADVLFDNFRRLVGGLQPSG